MLTRPPGPETCFSASLSEPLCSEGAAGTERGPRASGWARIPPGPLRPGRAPSPGPPLEESHPSPSRRGCGSYLCGGRGSAGARRGLDSGGGRREAGGGRREAGGEVDPIYQAAPRAWPPLYANTQPAARSQSAQPGPGGGASWRGGASGRGGAGRAGPREGPPEGRATRPLSGPAQPRGGASLAGSPRAARPNFLACLHFAVGLDLRLGLSSPKPKS